MRLARRTFKLAILSILPAALIAGRILLEQPKPDLLPKSSQVGLIPVWGYISPFPVHWFWLSSNSLGYLGETQDLIRVPGKRKSWFGRPRQLVCPFGVRGTDFEKAVAKLPYDEAASRRGVCVVSPDNKWLLYGPAHFADGSYEAIAIYSGRHLTWPTTPLDSEWDATYQTDPVWLPDSTGWVRTCYNPRTNSIERIEIRRLGTRAVESVRLRSHQLGGTVLGFTRQHRLLLVENWRGGYLSNQPIHLAELDLQTPGATPYRFEAIPPADGNIRSVSLSPRGDRLAWLSEVYYRPAQLPAFLQRLPLVLRPRVRSGRNHELWTSRLDGRGSKCLGVYPQRAGTIGYGTERCEWSPDGNRLAFSDGDLLWTVAAD